MLAAVIWCILHRPVDEKMWHLSGGYQEGSVKRAGTERAPRNVSNIGGNSMVRA